MKNTINGLADRTNRFGMRYVKRLIINEKGVYKDKFKENVVMGIMLAGYICVVWWLFKWSLG